MFFIGGDSPGTVETVFIVSGILLDLVSWHVWVYWFFECSNLERFDWGSRNGLGFIDFRG